MSPASAAYNNFRRMPVPQQVAQQLQVTTLPAPTRGLILNENESFMQPGGALQLDNWFPTMKGIALRGGCTRWCDLHALDAVVPPVPSALRQPVVSMFQYISGNVQRIFAGQTTKLFDTTAGTPVLVKSGQTSGNYVASQLANASGDHMLVCNDAGDYVLHFDGAAWTTFNAGQITGPAGTSVAAGHNLTYVWKYRGRFYFIEGGTMNAYYLGIDSFQGALALIPLAGAATKGGKLLWGASWSIDAGDGIDDKCVFCTDQGELLIFTGSNPADASNWRQEGRYATSVPLGMNAHQAIGGDILIATVDGIIPISASIQKDVSQLDLASITRAIKPMWRNEVIAKRALPWTMCKWDEQGLLFVTWPGGNPGNRYCAVVNIATGAWCRAVGYDAMCFARMRGDMFFGNQDGIVMQANRTGYDDGQPYTAVMVGGWEMFSSQATTMVFRQARASFSSGNGAPFTPQLSATTDYIITLPAPPPAAPDPGVADVWDQGVWGPTPGFTPPWSPSNPLPTQNPPSAPDKAAYLQWDQSAAPVPAVRNTGWVSIGLTGFSHAPIVQVTVAQQAPPQVELISIAALYEAAGVNV
jgi:hypothetical protein